MCATASDGDRCAQDCVWELQIQTDVCRMHAKASDRGVCAGLCAEYMQAAHIKAGILLHIKFWAHTPNAYLLHMKYVCMFGMGGGDCLVCLMPWCFLLYVALYPNKEKIPCCDLCWRVAANMLRSTLHVHNPEASDLGLYQCIVTDAHNRQANVTVVLRDGKARCNTDGPQFKWTLQCVEGTANEKYCLY